MSSAAGRPRRVAKQRRIVESDDEDEISITSNKSRDIKEESLPPREAIRQTRTTRRAAPAAASASAQPSAAASRARGRPKKTLSPTPTPSETVDSSDILGEDEISQADVTSTSTRTRGRLRRTPAASAEPSLLDSAGASSKDTSPSPGSVTPQKRRSLASRSSLASGASASDRQATRARTSMRTQIGSEDQPSLDEQATPRPRAIPKSRISAISRTTPTPQETPDALSTPASRPPATSLDTASASQLPRHSTPPAPQAQGSPLADITSNINEANLHAQSAVKPIKPTSTPLKPMHTPFRPLDTPFKSSMDPIMEKPMDIVLKSRTMTIPTVEDTTPKPRIVITHLILNNFKSYAGRQDVGPFHASFSSVVGPNGSGKSNVIDSLLFVFGFRASKMRQGKISALIHNSAQYPNLEFCEVAVHFQEVLDQPGGGHVVIPDSELIISRKAFRNNSSKYYINNKESNFTTVTTLLRDRGVDLDHKRFLILQGEVESIAQMKPKAANEHEDGLLEYLEDIIGTSKYKAPIEESAAEVETLNEVCVEKNTRVQHVEKEKNSLEEKKDKALAFIRDENELAMKQSALYQLYLHECSDNIAVTEEAINQMQAQLDVELEKHQGSQQIIKELEGQYEMGKRETEIREKQTQVLSKELAKFEQERVKFDEKKKFLEDKRKKLEKTIANAQKSAVEVVETIDQCGEDIETRAQEITALEKLAKEEEAELANIRENLKGKTQVFSDQIAVKQKSLEPWIEKINQKQSAIAVAESEMNILQDKANAGAVALQELEAKITSIEEGKVAKQKELKACQAEKAKLAKEAEKMKSELQILAEQEPKIRAKISNARQKADEARSSLANTQTRGNVLSALMRMKESGRIDGFQGRLGNLGAIDKKYDVAVSTACPSLDNFVTETVEAGQQCIEYLRKNNLGRGNFICLDKLRHRDLSPIQTPENAPRLFDLITAKEDRFLPAFYHAMQDTLVANDLAQANRIAYGARRWRVVTLDGELIDKSGTMSGGGTTVKRGLMSSKLVSDTTKEHVAKLEEDRDAWEAKFQEFQEYQRECETSLKELNQKIPQLDTKMQKIGLEMESATRNLADVQRRIKEVSNEYQPSAEDSKRISTLQKEIAKLTAEVNKIRGETSSVEEEIKALQDKIMKVGGEKLRAQRAKVDSIKEEISSHNDEVSNAEVRKAKAEKQKIKLEKDYAKATKDREAAIQDLQQLQDGLDNQGEKAEELRAHVEEAEQSLALMKKELKKLKAALDEKTTELNESRAVEIEMRNKLEENHKALTDNQKRFRYWEEKLSKLVLQDVDDLIGNSTRKTIKTEESEAPEMPSASVQGDNDSDVEMTDDDVEMTDVDIDIDIDDAASERTENGQSAPTRQPGELPRYTPDELAGMSKETLKGEIAALEEKTQNVNVDLGVLAEYRRRVEEHVSRASDLQTAIEQRDAAKKRCDDLRRLRLEGFMEGFSAISLRLKEMYQMITMGGNAELELVDSLDPFSEGILFSVMPPKKSWKNIGNLSGGEKTLSSLALVFALHHYKPTPLYVMDEIDAALDFRNVSIVANYIKERTKNAQFIVISLRNNMFELASRLVGVYKVNHMTKSVTIENKDFIDRPQMTQQPQRTLKAGNMATLTIR
ncbi:RecF/RecN/SMC N terminal domain-containing protein [Trichoderma barbatum]